MKWRNLFVTIFSFVVCIFIYKSLEQADWSEIKKLKFDFFPFLAAIAIALLFRCWLALSWISLLRKSGENSLPPTAELLYIYACSWMARYVPGKVTWIASKSFLLKKHSSSVTRIACTSVLEVIMQMTATLLLCVPLLLHDGRLAQKTQTLALYEALLPSTLIICALGLFIFYFLRRAQERIQILSLALSELMAPAIAAEYLVRYLIAAFLSASSYLILLSAVTTVSPGDWQYIIGCFALAGVVGSISLFAPAGIGVREGAQIVLLSAIFPAEIAIAVAILSRLFSTSVDILFFLIVKLDFSADRARHIKNLCDASNTKAK